ncbi:MAG: type 2 lanthipeptide synthetase LanM [Rhodococcus sp. (in: high G+C Gram-positive bacteria)]
MISVAIDPIASVTLPWVTEAADDARTVLEPHRDTVDVERVVAGVVHRLGRELCDASMSTVVDEFHRFRAQRGYPADPAADAASTEFGSVAAEILDRFPVLRGNIHRLVSGRLAQLREVIAALRTDLPTLVGEGMLGTGLVDRIDFGHGDPHDGGRHVVLVSVGTRTVVYKARSIGPDLLLHSLVRTIDCDTAAADSLRLPRVLSGACEAVGVGYGWQEHIAREDLSAAGGEQRFHRRLGRLLAVFTAVGATDMHLENVVAAAEYPVPIDVETLLHPSTEAECRTRALADGPLGTGMLPSGSDALSGTCIAGISPAGPRTVGGAMRPVLEHAGTDAMTLTPHPVVLDLSSHRPHRNANAIPVSDHVDDIVGGYHAGIAALRRHENSIRRVLSAAASTEFRRVVRPTSVYTAFLDAATHPRYLADPAERRRLFELLPASTMGGDDARRVELDLLCSGDVPRFVAPGGSSVLASRGRAGSSEVAAASPETAVDRAQRCLTRAIRSNPVAAEHVIRSALAGIDRPTAPLSRRVRDDDLHRALSVDDDRAGAARVARRVRARAIRSDSGAVLGTVHSLAVASSGSLVGSDDTLYGGGGAVLLDTALLENSILDPPRPDAAAMWRARAEESAAALIDDAHHRLSASDTSLCPYTGSLGTVWLLREYFAVTGTYDPVVDRLLASIVDHADIEHRDRLDVVGGLAGATALLAGTDWVGPEFLSRCADRLALALSEHHVTTRGLAHGVDGVAWALMRADVALGRTDHGSLVHDIASAATVPRDASWCWGSVGITLARAEIRYGLGDHRGAAALARTLVRSAAPEDDTLCHGDGGTVLALRHLACLLGDPVLEMQAGERTDRLRVRIARHGYATGHDHHVGALSFMTGVPGIAYARLKAGSLPDPIGLTASDRVRHHRTTPGQPCRAAAFGEVASNVEPVALP